jgi:hypothetical protein
MKKRKIANMNTVAKELCKLEGKKQNLSIAQIKEVLRCLKVLCNSKPVFIVVVFKYLFGYRWSFLHDGPQYGIFVVKKTRGKK